MFFFLYEMIQIKKEGRTYWYNYWNYFEIAQPLVYFFGVSQNIYTTVAGVNEKDRQKFLGVISNLLSLLKFL
jgi:hypothetical protein